MNGTRQGGQPVTLAALPLRQEGPASRWPRPLRERQWLRAVSSHRAWLAAVPVVLVNAVAFGAQLSFWRAHLALPAEAVAVALATESIANYLAWQAHLAQLADDAALRLRLAAYGTALVIGALNYSHYMLPGWRPTVAAVTFGMMSAISPWLWSVHSRRVSRDALKSRGLIEPHAVRLGMNRWLWHPVRSWRVMFRATWAGETDPARAIALIAEEVIPGDSAPATEAAILATAGVPGEHIDGGALYARLAAKLSAILTASDAATWPPDDGQDDRQDDDTGDDSEDGKDAPPLPPNPRQREQSALARATAKIRRYPDWPDAKVMEKTGASLRTVQRARAALLKE